MPSPTKPTDPVDWAETPPNPSNVTNPTALRAGGWSFQSALPFNFHNYLLRSLGRAATFLYALFSNAGDLTLGAVYGYIRLIADPANSGAGLYHVFRHVATGTAVTSRFEADTMRGLNALQAGDFALLVPTVDTADVTALEHTHTGSGVAELRSGSFAPQDSVPGDVTLSRATALYLGNLSKMKGFVTITWDAGGVPSVTSSGGYNVSGGALVAPAGGFPNGLRVDQTDDFVPGETQVTVSPTGTAASTAFIAYSAPTVSANQRLRVTLLYWTGAAWADALTTAAPLANSVALLYVTAA